MNLKKTILIINELIMVITLKNIIKYLIIIGIIIQMHGYIKNASAINLSNATDLSSPDSELEKEIDMLKNEINLLEIISIIAIIISLTAIVIIIYFYKKIQKRVSLEMMELKMRLKYGKE